MRALDLHRMLSRRAMVFGSIQAAAGMALLSRLYYLQFVKGDELATEAEGNAIKVQLLIPPRGIISDRYGMVLAGNHVNWRLTLESANKKEAAVTLKKLVKLMNIGPNVEGELNVALKRIRGGVPILVKEHLSWEELARVEFHLPQLPGASIEEGQWRNYPYADHNSHLLGYVGKVSEKEVKDDQPLLKQPDMKIGKNGIEALYDERLRGEAGTRQMEVNAAGTPVRELAKRPPKPGEELQLTIDNRLQEFTVQRLGSESGGVVVMNVHTGEILALASMPSYDPNEFSKGITQKYWDQLNANKKVPLMNKATAGQYPPGSTFKMITGLAALKTGRWNPQKRVHCPGHYYLGNHRFGCWKPEGHGSMNLAEAIQQSCDTYFYTAGKEAGIEAIADMCRQFGFGEVSGLGLRGEQPGIVPSPAWKLKAGRGPWNPGETINTSIGQGDVLTTPVQLAIMTARMVNGGKKIKPRLLMSDKVRVDGELDVDPKHLEAVRKGMYMAVNEPRGTAYGSRIAEEAWAMGGKTGTSQVRKLLVVGQNQNLLPWEFRHHGLFVGYAPVHAPEICCAVLIEHGGGGASAAAPVAKDVLAKAQELMEAPAPRALPIPKEEAKG